MESALFARISFMLNQTSQDLIQTVIRSAHFNPEPDDTQFMKLWHAQTLQFSQTKVVDRQSDR
jgi:hypothetical protein